MIPLLLLLVAAAPAPVFHEPVGWPPGAYWSCVEGNPELLWFGPTGRWWSGGWARGSWAYDARKARLTLHDEHYGCRREYQFSTATGGEVEVTGRFPSSGKFKLVMSEK